MQNDTTIFRIDHPTGFIALNVDTFFPCTQVKAKKLFRLVVQNCSEEEQDNLLALLIGKAANCIQRSLELDRRLDEADLDNSDRKDILDGIRRSQREHYRLKRNIEQFVARRGTQ